MKRIHLDTVDSTNRYAKELAGQIEESVFAVTASHQTAGRGRTGRSFESPNGTGIYLSICHKLPFSVEEVGLITAYAAVAVREAIYEQTGLECGIKWVNDLYLSGRKVCGILAEGRIDPKTGKLSHIIIGIGVNVTPPESGFIAAGKGVAASLGEFLSEPPQSNLIGDLTDAIIRRLEEIHPQMQSRAFMEDYRRHSLLIGREVTVYALTAELSEGIAATVLGIDQQAGLVVRYRDGRVQVLCSGEVSVRCAADDVSDTGCMAI